MIVIVDYGVGNIGGIINMFDRLYVESVVTSDPRIVGRASKLILPGVGAFDRAMRSLNELRLTDAIREASAAGSKILGVCLGMQLLGRSSEEGHLSGLGLIQGDTLRIPSSPDLRIPHMGWSAPTVLRPNALLPAGLTERFYFAHSFHLACDASEEITATVGHGTALVCAVQSGNSYGVQFHPEKSHRFGLRLLAAFAEL